jgi:hypothetical protein
VSNFSIQISRTDVIEGWDDQDKVTVTVRRDDSASTETVYLDFEGSTAVYQNN